MTKAKKVDNSVLGFVNSKIEDVQASIRNAKALCTAETDVSHINFLDGKLEGYYEHLHILKQIKEKLEGEGK